jgi:hypothetical protein
MKYNLRLKNILWTIFPKSVLTHKKVCILSEKNREVFEALFFVASPISTFVLYNLGRTLMKSEKYIIYLHYGIFLFVVHQLLCLLLTESKENYLHTWPVKFVGFCKGNYKPKHLWNEKLQLITYLMICLCMMSN